MTYPSKCQLPSSLLAGNRIRVDVGEASFFEGRQFRIAHEFAVDQNDRQVIKVDIGADTILTRSETSVDQAGVRYYIAVGGTPSGTFDQPITVIPKNTMSDAGAYTSQMAFNWGGDITGEDDSIVARVRVGNSNQRGTSVSGDLQARGFGASTVYLVIEPLDGTSATAMGVLYLEWEER